MSYEVIDPADLDRGEGDSKSKTLLSGEDHTLHFNHTYLDPGHSSPAEDFVIHPDCDQLEYIIYGTGKAVYPDGSHELKPGVAAYHSAGQPHRFDNDGDEPLIFVVATVVGEKDSADRVPYRPDE